MVPILKFVLLTIWGGTEVDENGYPILIVNIDVNEEDEED